MADNYLENKMAAFREGKTVVRRPAVSVEGLLDRLSTDASPDASVMPAQVQAVLRAGTIIKESKSFRYDTEEEKGIIRVLGPISPRRYLLEAGEVIMAMRLKAAELHLGCDIKIQPESTAPANPLIATLKLYRITNGKKNSTEPE